jgi:hypothetical protein
MRLYLALPEPRLAASAAALVSDAAFFAEPTAASLWGDAASAAWEAVCCTLSLACGMLQQLRQHTSALTQAGCMPCLCASKRGTARQSSASTHATDIQYPASQMY